MKYPKADASRQDDLFMSLKSNMSKVNQKRINLQKLNFTVLSNEDFAEQKSVTQKFAFNNDLYGDEKILKDISKIAVK
jgi:mRNA-degrading endonuclease HigB of HigAB toxin-antitoxin module